MTNFKYAGTIGNGGKHSARRHKVQGVIIHHGAQPNFQSLKNTLESPNTTVSANAMGSPQGIYLSVPENRRAWTSGSPNDGGKGADWDHKMMTIEIQNSTGAPSWNIAEETYAHVAMWIAYLSDKYGFTINRNTVIGHRELWERYRASYPTACPGGVDLDRLVRMANEYKNGGSATPGKDDDMPKGKMQFRYKGKQKIALGKTAGVHRSKNGLASLVTGNVPGSGKVLPAGDHMFTLNLELRGEPGTRVNVRLDRTDAKGKVIQQEKAVKVTLDSIGQAKIELNHARQINNDQRFRVRLGANHPDKDVKTPITVTEYSGFGRWW